MQVDDWTTTQLIQELGASDELARQHARYALVRRGTEAVPDLAAALGQDQVEIRWEAAKALTQTADARAAPALAVALADRDHGVGWLAAVALIRLGRDGLVATLEALVARPDSYRMHAGVHHVLHELRDLAPEAVDPVVAAIESPDRELTAPVAAERAVMTLTVPPL